MPSFYDIIAQLTSTPLPDGERIRLLNDFAYHFGWTPSDSLDISNVGEFANAHLVVEHGLQNTAVISFLRKRFADLVFEEKRRLLNVSYNNLVDWHIQIEPDQIIYVFNRADPARIVATHRVSRDELDNLRSTAFEQVSGKRQNPNLPALDDALIDTISYWKRYLSSELNGSVSNKELSALFNAIIFVRAVEDNFRRIYFASTTEPVPAQALLEDHHSPHTIQSVLRDRIFRTLARFGQNEVPQYLVNQDLLRTFDNLDRQTITGLFRDFYRIKYARPYEYDFSIMSKHALSRIYERYTNVLRIVPVESEQGVFFPPLPEETRNKAYGSVYTPEFIARFFARYLREQMPPLAFRRLSSFDPAIGSGIFLRTLLELQCDPTQGKLTTELIESAFENVIGLDIDPNACQAALLSLSLLHLVLANHLPSNLNVYAEEAIKFYEEHSNLRETRGVVVANPPFVSLETQTDAMRVRLAEFMANDASGRIDLYLAFLKIGLEMLKPGGYGLFILPHNFLIGENASGMRRVLSDKAWIRCLVDLSTIRVFEETDTYIILLIFQKRIDLQPAPAATIVKCQELVGKALQDVVEGHMTETKYYSIYSVDQETFASRHWIIAHPSEVAIRRKLESSPTMDAFLEIKQGFISGKDKVFIVGADKLPKGERKIFAPFLPDREMSPYAVPERTSHYFFYPFIEGRRIEEVELRERFPQTWRYLLAHKMELESRPPVRRKQLLWWQPERPRLPQNMMRPKIISPHLVVMPRFSLDVKGKYAISRSPLLYPKEVLVEGDAQEVGAENDLLRYFLAVLNSTVCFRYIAEHSTRYGSGYIMLEPRTLAKTPVPDPSLVPPTTMRRLLSLVDKRVTSTGSDNIALEKELDESITELYGLSLEEQQSLTL